MMYTCVECLAIYMFHIMIYDVYMYSMPYQCYISYYGEINYDDDMVYTLYLGWTNLLQFETMADTREMYSREGLSTQ